MFISQVYCALAVRFRPTSRVVSQIYRERTKDKLRTNEKTLTSWSNRLKPVFLSVYIKNAHPLEKKLVKPVLFTLIEYLK